MKKSISLILTIVLLAVCLSSCNFTQNLSGVLSDSAEATPKVEKMMEALALDNTEDGKALLHPASAEESDAALDQISDYLDGRKASSMEVTSINISASTGTAGKVRQEQVAYKVVLEDEAVIYLSVNYLSDNDGEGFASFQLILGVV